MDSPSETERWIGRQITNDTRRRREKGERRVPWEGEEEEEVRWLVTR